MATEGGRGASPGDAREMSFPGKGHGESRAQRTLIWYVQ